MISGHLGGNTKLCSIPLGLKGHVGLIGLIAFQSKGYYWFGVIHPIELNRESWGSELCCKLFCYTSKMDANPKHGNSLLKMSPIVWGYKAYRCKSLHTRLSTAESWMYNMVMSCMVILLNIACVVSTRNTWSYITFQVMRMLTTVGICTLATSRSMIRTQKDFFDV